MKVIYTRTMRVKDDGLGKAMEIGKGLAAVRKKHYPNHDVYFSFQMGGDPRTIRETLIGTMFEGEIDGDTFIIRDEVKTKRTLTYIGTDTVFKYFTRFDKDFIRIYSINIDNPIGQTKFSKDGKTKLGTYDLKISELWGVGLKYVTFCNYQ